MNQAHNQIYNKQIIQKLSEITALKYLEKEDLEGILKSSKMIQYEPGETIISEGKYGKRMYFLIIGKVGILKQGETIAIFKRSGDLFGEIGIIDNLPRSASIVAIENTVCLAIDTTYAKKLKGNEKEAFNAIIYRIFAEILAERLRSTDEELVKVKDENSILRSEIKKLKQNLP